MVLVYVDVNLDDFDDDEILDHAHTLILRIKRKSFDEISKRRHELIAQLRDELMTDSPISSAAYIRGLHMGMGGEKQ